MRNHDFTIKKLLEIGGLHLNLIKLGKLFFTKRVQA